MRRPHLITLNTKNHAAKFDRYSEPSLFCLSEPATEGSDFVGMDLLFATFTYVTQARSQRQVTSRLRGC